MVLEVYVYGGGKVFQEYFNAIAALVGTSDFHRLFHIAIILAGMTVLWSAISKRDFFSCVRWFGLYYFVVYVLFLPTVAVQIIDQTNPGSVQQVQNVPLGLGVLASVTSSIGNMLTQTTETVFTMPDYLPYAKTGMVMASKLVEASTQFEITDAKFNENLQSYVGQCIFYDLLLGKYSLNDLLSADRPWEFIQSKASPARAFIYNGQVTTCAKGVPQLTTDWKGAVTQAKALYGGRLFSESLKPQEQLATYLPMSYSYLTKISESAENIIQTNLLSNAIQTGVLRFGASTNAPAALASYAFTRAQEQQRMTHQTIGEEAAYWLPLLKNALEAIMYGCFIFVILLAVFPFGPYVLKNYALSLMWLQTWAPLYAIINLICSYYAQAHSSALVTGGVLSIQSLASLRQINQDIAGLAGYLSMSVPFLAAGLTKGLVSVLSQLSQSVMGVTQGTASSAVAEAASGNISLGNTSFGTHSAFNTSANHFDTLSSFTTGLQTQLRGGEKVTILPSGRIIMDRSGLISNLGVELHLSDSIQTAFTNQADQAYTSARNDMRMASQSYSSGLQNLLDFGHHFGSSKGSGESWGYSTDASVSQALHNASSLTEKFAQDHKIDYGTAANVLSAVYGDLKGGVSGTLGGGAGSHLNFGGTGMSGSVSASGSLSLGGSKTAQHEQRSSMENLYSNARDFIQTTDYSHNVDVALKGVHDQSFRTTTEAGASLLQSTSASLNQANTWQHEASSSLQAAMSYQEMATKTQEKGMNVNANLSPEFYEWMANQPGTDGRGHLGPSGVSQMLDDPVQRQLCIDRFSEQYVNGLASQWSHGMPHSKAGVEGSYKQSQDVAESSSSIQSNYQSNQESLLNSSKQQGIDPSKDIDDSTKRKSEDLIDYQDRAVKSSKTHLDNLGNVQKGEVLGEQGKERSGFIVKDAIFGIKTDD